MKKFLLAAVGVIALAAPALAADMAPRVYTKAIDPVYSWTGFYIGGNVGGGAASSHFDDPCFYCSSATPTRGYFTGGGQIGYNYQFGNGLVGLEADINGNSNFKGSFIGGDDGEGMAVRMRANVSGTIRARGGFVMNNALIYVTGGAAWANISQTGIEQNNVTFIPTGITANGGDNVRWGGVIGAGVEFALSPNWTVGGEFLHTMYEDRSAAILNAGGGNACGGGNPSTNCVIRAQLTTDVARLRFNYKFAQ